MLRAIGYILAYLMVLASLSRTNMPTAVALFVPLVLCGVLAWIANTIMNSEKATLVAGFLLLAVIAWVPMITIALALKIDNELIRAAIWAMILAILVKWAYFCKIPNQ